MEHDRTRPALEEAEAVQVRANILKKTLEQPGDQNSNHARPPVEGCGAGVGRQLSAKVHAQDRESRGRGRQEDGPVDQW